MRMNILAGILFGLSACATLPSTEDTEEVKPVTHDAWYVGTDPGPPPLPEPTRILDRNMATKLRENSGITLQWITWDQRGTVQVAEDERGVWRLSGIQRGDAANPGMVSVQGVVTEVGSDYFLLDGTIRIEDAPDAGRRCEQDKLWRFGITQNRKYWRLREFEWCDYLTDYIDIYF